MDRKQDELLSKFHSVHNSAIASKDVEDMRIASSVFIKTFEELAECNPKKAQDIVECYEGTLKYYNFLTETEAEEIVSKFVNQDGSKGPRWRDPEEFFQKVTEMGGMLEHEPHYNKWALYVTANMYASDQHNTLMKWVGNDRTKYVEACYDLAIAKLKDKDRLSWIRWYFGVSDKI